jgi:hypothetical protein
MPSWRSLLGLQKPPPDLSKYTNNPAEGISLLVRSSDSDDIVVQKLTKFCSTNTCDLCVERDRNGETLLFQAIKKLKVKTVGFLLNQYATANEGNLPPIACLGSETMRKLSKGILTSRYRFNIFTALAFLKFFEKEQTDTVDQIINIFLSYAQKPENYTSLIAIILKNYLYLMQQGEKGSVEPLLNIFYEINQKFNTVAEVPIDIKSSIESSNITWNEQPQIMGPKVHELVESLPFTEDQKDFIVQRVQSGGIYPQNPGYRPPSYGYQTPAYGPPPSSGYQTPGYGPPPSSGYQTPGYRPQVQQFQQVQPQVQPQVRPQVQQVRQVQYVQSQPQSRSRGFTFGDAIIFTYGLQALGQVLGFLIQIVASFL